MRGSSSLLGAVEEASAEEVERLYRTNVFGLPTVTRAVLPQMRIIRPGCYGVPLQVGSSRQKERCHPKAAAARKRSAISISGFQIREPYAKMLVSTRN